MEISCVVCEVEGGDVIGGSAIMGGVVEGVETLEGSDVLGHGCGVIGGGDVIEGDDVVGGGCGVGGGSVVGGCGVVGDGVGVAGSIVVDGVMMVSGGQVESLVLKVTSARCTQLEVEESLNTKVSTGRSKPTLLYVDMHTLTRESQEVVVGEIVVRKVLLPDVDVALKRSIVLTDIPHSGQLNITTSTLPTPV